MSEIYCIVAKVDCWCNVDPEIALIHVEVEREKGLTYVIEKVIDMCTNNNDCTGFTFEHNGSYVSLMRVRR